jgi:hypothetical protein
MHTTHFAVIALVMAACTQTSDPKVDFFAEMSTLCGQTLKGESVWPDDPAHDFYGADLTATFAACSDTEIQIPFQVNEDKSRTWIITKSDTGLLFKHDHRHEDGSPDSVTNYGGWAHDAGSRYEQSFMADADTGALIPAAVTNVWTFTIDRKAGTLTYYLERHGQPRYKASFSL